MACKAFLSYHGINIKLAKKVAKQLEASGIEVVRYNPGIKWDDAPSTVVLEIESSDCVVYLKKQTNPSDWVQAELKWAKANEVPVIPIGNVSDVSKVIPQILATKDQTKYKLSEGDRWFEMKRIFLEHVEDAAKSSDEFITHNTQYTQMQGSMNSAYGLGFLLKIISKIIGGIALLSGIILFLFYLYSNISLWWWIGSAIMLTPAILLFILGRYLMRKSNEWDDKYVRDDPEDDN